MLNLFLGLVLTSAIGIADISGNDVLEDNPIMLTSEVPSDATNQDIVNAIDNQTDIIESILDPLPILQTSTISDIPICYFYYNFTNNVVQSLSESAFNGGRGSYYFPVYEGHTYSLNYSVSTYGQTYFCFLKSLPDYSFDNTIITDFTLLSSTTSSFEYTATSNGFILVSTGWGYGIFTSLSDILDSYYSYKTFSMSQIGSILSDEQRQLDNISFCVILLAFYPLIQDIIKKLGFRKELK